MAEGKSANENGDTGRGMELKRLKDPTRDADEVKQRAL